MNSRLCANLCLIAGCLALVCLLGCEAPTTAPTRTTSHEDIEAFLKENPEYATPSGSASGGSELGLER